MNPKELLTYELIFVPKSESMAIFYLSPYPLSPASGGISNMKWRGGQRG
jgi:hypothetical protein